MHILRDPSFFFTNNTGAPHGEILGIMKPSSSNSLSSSFNSFNSAGAIQLGRIEMRLGSGRKSIPGSGRFSRILLEKTYKNSLTTGTNSMRGFSETKSLTFTIWYKHPFEII